MMSIEEVSAWYLQQPAFYMWSDKNIFVQHNGAIISDSWDIVQKNKFQIVNDVSIQYIGTGESIVYCSVCINLYEVQEEAPIIDILLNATINKNSHFEFKLLDQSYQILPVQLKLKPNDTISLINTNKSLTGIKSINYKISIL